MRRRSQHPARSAREQHRAWLELVDTEGPFLAVPVLATAWPQGIPQIDPAAKAELSGAKPAFDAAWDAWDRNRDVESALDRYRTAREIWVDNVLRKVLGWGELWSPADPLISTATVTSPDGRVTVTPTGVIRHGDRIGALIWIIDPVTSLRDPSLDGWSDNPVDRMEQMLRKADLPIGLVTDGRWWGLVSAPAKTLAASGVVDAQTWVEEPAVRDAFVELLSKRHLLGGREDERLPALFAKSVLAAEEITEALGVQVRKAVELVVTAVSESAAATRERGETDPLPDDGDVLYEGVVTVLMRVVFLLFAEERGLLPQGQLYTLGYGLSDQLDELSTRARNEGESSLDATHLTWYRLLATSHALYAGATFEDMRLPAYGGSLFDPERFPFLTATTERGTLALMVSDRVLLKVLEAVQTAKVKGEDARRISFRDIDVEQIGYIYEGLLGYTCKRADEVIVGLVGKDGAEPEIALDTLDDLYEANGTDSKTAAAVIAWAKEHQAAAKAPSPAALAKAFASGDLMEDAELALRNVTRDEDLRSRLRPWIGAIRRDLRDRPVVFEPGGWLVVETPSRRNAGAHYTPRALAEEVVLYALEPIVYAPGPYQTPNRDAWRLKSSTELLDLKVADIACGSGAFLVAAARYLAARLVEAWHAEGVAVGHTAHELEVRALREVVAHCLYGADINGMAVEMCKLSLWLVSLDPGLPFSFVDDKVLHGNSLLGLTSLRQLEALHIDPQTKPLQGMFDLRGDELVERLDIDDRIRRATQLREQLSEVIDNGDPQRSASAKHGQLQQFRNLTRELRKIADGVIAAGLALGGKPGKKLDEAYENLRLAVGRAFPADPSKADKTALDAIIAQGLTPTVETDYDRWQPLHWCLEVPDVLSRGGFDAIVGNPPFLGGKKVGAALGSNLRDWCSSQLAQTHHGGADLAAYFLLRVPSLLTKNGSFGLIATNSIAQGDTRQVGLDRLLENGLTIARSWQSRPWPAKTANLEFAAVWASKATLGRDVRALADGKGTVRISSLLEPEGSAMGLPVRLLENRGICFIGCFINGIGFTMTPFEAEEMIKADPRNSEVLRPYLGGEDLNRSPNTEARRWIVDFDDRGEALASTFAEPWQWSLERVRPGRTKVKGKPRVRDRWWLYEANARRLRDLLRNLEYAVALTGVSRTIMPARVNSDQVFGHTLAVFATEKYADQAVLSSSMHQMWAIKYGSGMRNDPRYTPSDVFETFPRPESTRDLETIGSVLDEERREIMLRRDLGLTKLYNLINDPDIVDSSDADVARLRQIHIDIDHAVMAAYGWDDVPLDRGFHSYRQMTRWTVSPAARVEILDRLLEENHRRAALQGDAPSPSDDDSNDGEGEE